MPRMARPFSVFLLALGWAWLLAQCISVTALDPFDFFMGAQSRPKLQITRPANGEVLDDSRIDISIKIDGYDMPSAFHDSQICIALSTGSNVAEQCFEQTIDLVFHADGLSAGETYSLRVAFYERGSAIAVSVRSFRVAGIRGVPDYGADKMVTIQAAVQVAMKYQINNMIAEAETVYRNILSENPTHPDALHLLGLIFYQRGDAEAAVPYIEKALLGNKTFEGFHNSLGECYRILGRVKDAKTQFALALKLNPGYVSADYNMGLALQDNNEWDEAIHFYHKVNSVVDEDPGTPLVEERVKLESRIRECDLLKAQTQSSSSGPYGGQGGGQGGDQREQALRCWEGALRLFPGNDVVINELGQTHAQLGSYETAIEFFRVAAQRGNFVAELNAAHILELLGYCDESRAAYREALQHAIERGLPTYHVRVRLATVMPRIVPGSERALQSTREDMEADLDALVSMDSAFVDVDNSPPLYFGFSQGFHLAFHGKSNVALKSKLFRVYSRLCPALLQGYFMDRGTMNRYKNKSASAAVPTTDQPTEISSHSGGDRVNSELEEPDGQARLAGQTSVRTGSSTGDDDDDESESGATATVDASLSEGGENHINSHIDRMKHDLLADTQTSSHSGSRANNDGDDNHDGVVGTEGDPDLSVHHHRRAFAGKAIHTTAKSSPRTPSATAASVMSMYASNGDEEDDYSERDDGDDISGDGLELGGRALDSPLGSSGSRMCTLTSGTAFGGGISGEAGAGMSGMSGMNGMAHCTAASSEASPGAGSGTGTGSKKVPGGAAGLTDGTARTASAGGSLADSLTDSFRFDLNFDLFDAASPMKDGSGEDVGDSDAEKRIQERRRSRVRKRKKRITSNSSVDDSDGGAEELAVTSPTSTEPSQGPTSIPTPNPARPEELLSGSSLSEITSEESIRAVIPHRFNELGEPLIRIGIASRFLRVDETAGVLVHGLVPLLVEAGYEVIVFHIDGSSPDPDVGRRDPVVHTVADKAHLIAYMPGNIGDSARVIRSTDLDVLIYPDIGYDPVAYFLAFAKLAPVQVCWMGHPDTTGIASMDYFLSIDAESIGAEAHYTERLHTMRGLGTVFVDTYRNFAPQAGSDTSRTALLNRARVFEALGFPRAAHLYLIAQPLYRLHASFDAVLSKILLQDRLGYVVVMDSGAMRASMQKLLTARLLGGYSEEVKSRLIYYQPSTYADYMTVVSAAHVMLDPFPVSGLLPCLQALAVGVPVITMPSDRLGGRFALALYKQMNFGLAGSRGFGADGSDLGDLSPTASPVSSSARPLGAAGASPITSTTSAKQNIYAEVSDDPRAVSLVVRSPSEYVSLALALTHKPKLRDGVASELLSEERRGRLFAQQGTTVYEEVVEDWMHFLHRIAKR